MRCLAIIVALLLFSACSRQEPPPQTETSPPATPATELPPPPPALTGTAWKVAGIDGVELPSDSKASLEFLEGDKVAGQGGCNRFGGPVEISGDKLRFGSLISTKMACAAMEWETRYFQALDAARTYRLDGGALVLLDDKAAERVRLNKK